MRHRRWREGGTDPRGPGGGERAEEHSRAPPRALGSMAVLFPEMGKNKGHVCRQLIHKSTKTLPKPFPPFPCLLFFNQLEISI